MCLGARSSICCTVFGLSQFRNGISQRTSGGYDVVVEPQRRAAVVADTRGPGVKCSTCGTLEAVERWRRFCRLDSARDSDGLLKWLKVRVSPRREEQVVVCTNAVERHVAPRQREFSEATARRSGGESGWSSMLDLTFHVFHTL